MNKKTILLLTAVLFSGMVANAQYRAEDNSGNVVRRVNFDREQVTEVRTNGTTFPARTPLVINRVLASDTATVGIEDVTVDPHQQTVEYYDLMGRRVDDMGQMPCGVYLKKEGTKVRKVVKMRKEK